ncbi:MAG: hypothetical protein WCC10_03930, partial [Tumebacillaceae bacterium]
SMTTNRSRDLLAVVATDKKHLGGGKAQVFLAETPEQALTLTQEVARALQGEVVSLSNGLFLIIQV